MTGGVSCPPRGVVGEPEQARGGQGLPLKSSLSVPWGPPPVTGPQPQVPHSGLDVAPMDRWGSCEDSVGEPGGLGVDSVHPCGSPSQPPAALSTPLCSGP